MADFQPAAIFQRPLPDPLPQNAIIIIGANWCEDTERTLTNNNFNQTRDGRPIYYFNDADPALHARLRTLPGANVLGGGFDAATPPARPTRTYNYPTVLEVSGGRISRVLFSDIVPQNGLQDPNALAATAAQPHAPWANLPRLESVLRDQGPLPAAPGNDQLYILINRNCGGCRGLLEGNNFASRTEDGRRITYVDAATPEGIAFRDRHFNGQPRTPTYIQTDARGAMTQIDARQGLDRYFPALSARAAQAAAIDPARTPDRTVQLSQTQPRQDRTMTAPQTHDDRARVLTQGLAGFARANWSATGADAARDAYLASLTQLVNAEGRIQFGEYRNGARVGNGGAATTSFNRIDPANPSRALTFSTDRAYTPVELSQAIGEFYRLDAAASQAMTRAVTTRFAAPAGAQPRVAQANQAAPAEGMTVDNATAQMMVAYDRLIGMLLPADTNRDNVINAADGQANANVNTQTLRQGVEVQMRSLARHFAGNDNVISAAENQTAQQHIQRIAPQLMTLATPPAGQQLTTDYMLRELGTRLGNGLPAGTIPTTTQEIAAAAARPAPSPTPAPAVESRPTGTATTVSTPNGTATLRPLAHEISPLQAQLRQMGIAIGAGKSNAAVVAAAQTFYNATRLPNTPEVNFGADLSEVERTQLLNGMQAAAQTPAQHAALRTFATALNVDLNTLPRAAAIPPANNPAAQDQGQQSRVELRLPGTERRQPQFMPELTERLNGLTNPLDNTPHFVTNLDGTIRTIPGAEWRRIEQRAAALGLSPDVIAMLPPERPNLEVGDLGLNAGNTGQLSPINLTGVQSTTGRGRTD